jgi:hypothetical protein
MAHRLLLEAAILLAQLDTVLVCHRGHRRGRRHARAAQEPGRRTLMASPLCDGRIVLDANTGVARRLRTGGGWSTEDDARAGGMPAHVQAPDLLHKPAAGRYRHGHGLRLGLGHVRHGRGSGHRRCGLVLGHFLLGVFDRCGQARLLVGRANGWRRALRRVAVVAEERGQAMHRGPVAKLWLRWANLRRPRAKASRQ